MIRILTITALLIGCTSNSDLREIENPKIMMESQLVCSEESGLQIYFELKNVGNSSISINKDELPWAYSPANFEIIAKGIDSDRLIPPVFPIADHFGEIVVAPNEMISGRMRLNLLLDQKEWTELREQESISITWKYEQLLGENGKIVINSSTVVKRGHGFRCLINPANEA